MGADRISLAQNDVQRRQRCATRENPADQVIEFEYENEKTQVETEKGVVEIEAPSMILRVTATDASGNVSVANIQPRGLTGDNDVETDLSDD